MEEEVVLVVVVVVVAAQRLPHQILKTTACFLGQLRDYVHLKKAEGEVEPRTASSLFLLALLSKVVQRERERGREREGEEGGREGGRERGRGLGRKGDEPLHLNALRL